VINAQPTLNIWTGAVSTDWNTDANWSCGGVPINTTNVLIPSILVSGRFPVISTGAPGYVNNIEIQNNNATTLEIIDNYIEIYGTLTLNGNIDLNGEAQLIQTTGSILDAASSGSIEIDQQGAASTYAYNYWGSPVGTNIIPSTNSYSYKLKDILYDGANPAKFISGYNGAMSSPISIANRWIYKYTNKTGAYSEWQQIGSTGDIKAGEGFSMKGPDPTIPLSIDTYQKYTFKGLPNNGNILLGVDAGNEYLVANPYPSAIEILQFILDNPILDSGVIYFWEQFDVTNHNLANYEGAYWIANGSGGVSAAIPSGINQTPSSGSNKTPAKNIPVAQGFFVKADKNAPIGSTIKFSNSQRVFVPESSGDAVFMKSNNPKNKTAIFKNKDVRPKLRLGFEAPKLVHRQLLLTIDESATDAIDWGYDGEMSDVLKDDMYWDLANKKYLIQATNSITLDKEIPLGIVISETGLATIKIDALENVDESVELYIKDALTGKTHQINTQPFEIALDAGTYVDRFSLTFSPQNVLGIEADILKQGIHVFMNNTGSEIQIRNTVQSELLNVKLFNSIGQLQNSWNKNLDNQNISLPINNKATGIYLVQINTTTGTISKKVVIE